MSRLDKIVSETHTFKLDCLQMWNIILPTRKKGEDPKCLHPDCEYCPFAAQHKSNRILQALMPELNQK